jgi:hypothetical protein
MPLTLRAEKGRSLSLHDPLDGRAALATRLPVESVDAVLQLELSGTVVGGLVGFVGDR